jgi:hypothetical protein
MAYSIRPDGQRKTTTPIPSFDSQQTGRKIITVSPIEYRLKGVLQTQTDDKRATLSESSARAPSPKSDIMMIGESMMNVDRRKLPLLDTWSLPPFTRTMWWFRPTPYQVGTSPTDIASSVNVYGAKIGPDACPDCKKKRR